MGLREPALQPADALARNRACVMPPLAGLGVEQEGAWLDDLDNLIALLTDEPLRRHVSLGGSHSHRLSAHAAGGHR